MRVDANILPPRYRGATRIGRGGMGEIYCATDESLGRTVAVKVLAEHYALDESVRERFTREALAAARLSGRTNVVTIFDVGEWQARPYIVMEYLAGGSLGEALRSGPIEPARAVSWLEQAAVALDAAHAEGVVHRDVKPGNLLLDRDGNVHVADFGIASAAGMDSMTKTGTVLGTAGYLSPEQAQGERATPASDRYALAVVAFELLTGERPYQGDTAAAEAAAHIHAPIPLLSERRSDLPPQLDRVFEQALAKEPRQRYASAADFVADLRHALADAAGTTAITPPAPTRPAEVAAPPARPPLRPFRRARPAWLVPLLALLALLALGGIAAAVLARGEDDDDPAAAELTTIVRTVTAEGTTQRVEVPVTVTAQTPPATTAEPPPATEQQPAPGTLSVAQARALQDESTAEMGRGNWTRALALSQQALAALRGRDRTYEGYANFNIGNSLAHLGRCDEALPHLDRREQLLGPHPAVTAARRLCGAG